MKKKLLILLALMVLIPLNVFAEELKIDWLNSWGGSDYDYIESTVLTDDGGFIALGRSKSADIDGLPNKGFEDAIILKYDKDGNLLWQKSWGGSDTDILYDLILLDDGSFIAHGITYSTDIDGLTIKGGTDGVVVRFDKDGNVVWQKSWGGSDNDYFRELSLMDDGSFLVIGESKSTDISGLTNKGYNDGILLKYDKDGNLLWQKNYGGNRNDTFKFILDSGDGYLVVCESYSSDIAGLPLKGNADYIVVKYDENGNVIWNIRWGGSGVEIFRDIDLTSDGGFIISGCTYSTDIEGLTLTQSAIESDAILLKFDKDGNVVWQKSNLNFSIYAETVVTTEGNIIVRPSSSGTLIKYDKDGNVFWEKSLGGDKNLSDYYNGLIPDDNDGFIAYGALFSTNIPGLPNKGGTDNVIVKFDKDGNIVWKTSFGGSSTDRTMLMIPKNRNTFIEIGYTMSSDIDGILYKGQFDLTFAKYVVKYNIDNIDSDNGSFESVQNENYGIVNPSPDEGYEVDKIIVKDSTGNEITSVKQNTGVYSFELYDDVTVEVVFKKNIENPNTGGNIFIILMFVITISFIGVLFAFKKRVKVYEV